MPSNKLSSRQKPKPISPPTVASFGFEAIGTQWQITIEQHISPAALRELKQAIAKRIAQFDQHYSRFRADSLIAKMAQDVGSYQLPKDAKPLFDLYQELYELSEGHMTPLIGNALSDAGYDANYSLRPKALQATPSWNEALSYDYPKLIINQPVLLDLGAAGKGYLVDIVTKLMKQAGLSHFCINAGGDIVNSHVSQSLATIGLEHPLELDQVIGIAEIPNGSLCGSAGNRRVWDKFHHLIDPYSKQSPRHLLATWVVAPNALLADGVGTALFFVSAEVLLEHYSFDYALIRSDLSLEHSRDFPAHFFTEASLEANNR
jgi:thiamine biosynthesis lipoprotein